MNGPAERAGRGLWGWSFVPMGPTACLLPSPRVVGGISPDRAAGLPKPRPRGFLEILAAGDVKIPLSDGAGWCRNRSARAGAHSTPEGSTRLWLQPVVRCGRGGRHLGPDFVLVVVSGEPIDGLQGSRALRHGIEDARDLAVVDVRLRLPCPQDRLDLPVLDHDPMRDRLGPGALAGLEGHPEVLGNPLARLPRDVDHAELAP